MWRKGGRVKFQQRDDMDMTCSILAQMVGRLGLVLVARVGARLLGIEVHAAMAKSNLVLCNFTLSAVEAFYLPGLAPIA